MKITRCPTCRQAVELDKTKEQRNAFHQLCRMIGKELGETPGHVKAAVKQEHFGIDEFKIGNKWYRTVKSSEDTDRIEYSELIETALRWAATEHGIVCNLKPRKSLREPTNEG
jgi:hypothetical protein